MTQNALKNIRGLWKKVKTSTRDDAHLSMAFTTIELTHIVFELGLINPINIL